MSKRYNIWNTRRNSWTNLAVATLIPGSRHDPKPFTLQAAKAILASDFAWANLNPNEFVIKEFPKQYNVWDVEQNQFARWATWDDNKQRPKHLSQKEALRIARDCSRYHHRPFVVKEIPACLL